MLVNTDEGKAETYLPTERNGPGYFSFSFNQFWFPHIYSLFYHKFMTLFHQRTKPQPCPRPLIVDSL